MRFCPNCYLRTEQAVNFCPNCGNTMAETVTYPPVERNVPLAKKIVAMALSAFGIALAVSGFFETIAFSMMYDNIDGGLIAAIMFAMFSLPGSIIGLVMSNSNISNGDTSAFSRVGKILGIVGIIAAGFSFMIGLVF